MTTISVRLEDSEKEQLKEYADKNDLSMSQVIRKAIKLLISEENQE
jgi:predicted transcriptional regulator